MNEIYTRYPLLSECESDIEALVRALCTTFENGGRLLLCGNGGSAADCEHIAGELLKSFNLPRPCEPALRARLTESFGELGTVLGSSLEGGLPAIPLVSFAAFSTAFANDADADAVFAQGVCAVGKKGDMLLTLSTSGNSKNCVNAAMTAVSLGIKTAALTGAAPSLLLDICEYCVRVPAKLTPEVQELHLPVYHYICSRVENYFFG